MALDARTFALELGELGKSMPEENFRDMRDAYLFEALNGCVLGTPVDKGHAKGNWQIAQELTSIDELPDSANDISGSDTIAREAAKIPDLDLFILVWVANVVPYIIALEDGHSKQGAHWVAATHARLVELIR